MNKLSLTLLATAVLAGAAAESRAQVTTFAQFLQSPTTGNPFSYEQVTNGANSTQPGTTMTYTGGNVSFRYLSSPITAGLPGGVVGVDIPAVLTYTVTGVQQVPDISSVVLQEPINDISFSFVSAAGGPVAPGQVLLTGSATNASKPNAGVLFGINGGNASSLVGSDPVEDVVFTSPYITANDPGFTGFKDESYAFSFSSTIPSFSASPGGTNPPITGFLNNFTAAGTGTFSSGQNVPEPGSLALLIGTGVAGSVGFRRRRRSRK